MQKSRNAFGTLGTWDDYERGKGDPNWKDVNWGGWDATDADFFGEARKWFEGHQVYGQHVGDYGSKNLFDSFGGEHSYYNPGKTVGTHNKWKNNKADLFRLAKDLYYYESKNPLAPEPEPPPPPPPAPPQQATWDEEVDLSPKPIDVSGSPEPIKGIGTKSVGETIDTKPNPLTWLDGNEPLRVPAATEGQEFSQQAVAGATPEQLAQIQADIDAQRDQYQTMLDDFKATSEAEKADLMASFEQQMQDYKSQQIEENKQKEAQTQSEFTDWWSQEQDALVEKYQGLLDQAGTDHEAALIKQQQAFEQTQLDKEAAWNNQLQDLSKEADVYDSQISELKGELGIQEGLYDTLASDYSDFQIKSAEDTAALTSDFQQQIGGLQSDYGELQSDFGTAKADWATQAGDFKAEIGDLTGQVGGLETTLGEYTKRNTELEAAVKRNEELAIQNAERARVSASYGSQGTPMNKQVQGVRTLNELTPAGTFGGGTTGSFNRKGLRIKNLNV